MPLYVIVRNLANLYPIVVSTELSIHFFKVSNSFTRKSKHCVYACYEEAKYKFVTDLSN